MKKLIMGTAIALSLAGCATVPNPSVTTPDKIVAKFCPLAQALNQQISTFPGVSENVLKDLDVARPVIAAVCTSGAKITSLDLKSLSSAAIPALLDIVAASPAASTPQGQAIIVGLDLVQVLLVDVVADLPLVN